MLNVNKTGELDYFLNDLETIAFKKGLLVESLKHNDSELHKHLINTYDLQIHNVKYKIKKFFNNL